MQHILTTLHKADPHRVARAAAGLADGSILVNVIHQDETEARALVPHQQAGMLGGETEPAAL
jgi:hypothetical protein